MVCALSISLGSTSFTKHFPGNTCYLTTYFWDSFLSQVTLLVSHPGFLAQHQSVFATGSISHAFHYFAFFTCKIVGIREKPKTFLVFFCFFLVVRLLQLLLNLRVRGWTINTLFGRSIPDGSKIVARFKENVRLLADLYICITDMALLFLEIMMT